MRASGLALGAMAAALACGAWAEDLDLTRARTVDWAKEAFGAVKQARALISPTADPKTLAEELRKGHGARLSSEDPEHAVVLALGPLEQGATYVVSQALIDRFRHIVELTVEITRPSREARAAAAENAKKPAPEDELIIAPADAPPPKPAGPQTIEGAAAENSAVIIPAGKLEFGTWYLRVKTFVKDGGKRAEAPALTDTFTIKDDRPYTKELRGRKTPEIGMQKPDSPSVTEGMGGR